MTKRAKTIADRLKIVRQSMGSVPHELFSKCLDFLCNLEETPNKKNLCSDDLIHLLQVRHKAARRIAYAIMADQNRRNANLTDSETSFEEIGIHKQNEINKLKFFSEKMKEILDDGISLPLPIRTIIEEVTSLFITPIGTVGKKVKRESLSAQLACLNAKLDEHPLNEFTFKKHKKGRQPYRLDFIRSLFYAWCEVTNRKPEKLKRNRKSGKPYGKFYEFMNEGLKLLGRGINTEEAIKDVWKHCM